MCCGLVVKPEPESYNAQTSDGSAPGMVQIINNGQIHRSSSVSGQGACSGGSASLTELMFNILDWVARLWYKARWARIAAAAAKSSGLYPQR